MNSKSDLFGHVTNCVDVVIPPSASVVQVSDVKEYVRMYFVCVLCHWLYGVSLFSKDCLLAFVEMAQTNYGCLLVDGKVCIATESWWVVYKYRLCGVC